MESDTDGLSITASSRFTLDMIEKQIGEDLRSTLREQVGNPSASIRYSLRKTAPAAVEMRPTPGRDAGNSRKSQVESLIAGPAPTRGPIRKNLPSCPTIEGFLVGHANKLAFGAIEVLLESPGGSPPVFIHGSCGVGKTHLLRATAQRYRQMMPGAKVRYITGEAFVNSFVQAIRTKTVEAFEKKFRGLDVLCLDDVHMVAGKESTQHELLQIFNKLSLGGCKVLLASDAHPRDIARLDQALSSRFSAGLVVKVEEPDLELARRLVSHIAGKRGVFLDAPAIQTIVDRVGIGQASAKPASVRDLEGAILQIQAVARLMDQSTGNGPSTQPAGNNSFNSTRTPTMSHIRKALALRDGSDHPHANGPVALDTIITRICSEMTVSKSDLTGKGRQKKVVMARELIVHTARSLTSKSFPEIAYAIGRPNHSTVITAAKRFKDRVKECQPIAVGCPHDGMPAGELAAKMASCVH